MKPQRQYLVSVCVERVSTYEITVHAEDLDDAAGKVDEELAGCGVERMRLVDEWTREMIIEDIEEELPE